MTDTTLPYIPETITVHLGAPNQPAENVTVSFRDYIKNVASSEIYPTWEDAALRANILAQISFALNKIIYNTTPAGVLTLILHLPPPTIKSTFMDAIFLKM